MADASAFAEGFFQRHPGLRKYAPARTLDKPGTAPGHGEARQSGADVWLFPKFWVLPKGVQEYVYAHELGHLFSTQHNEALQQAWEPAGIDPWDTPNLPYGQFNQEEAFADCFASYHLTPSELKQRYPLWFKLIGGLTHGKVAAGSMTLHYNHRVNSIPTPNMGTMFNQHLEPSGEYLSVQSPGDSEDAVYGDLNWATGKTWIEYGTITFHNPLVLPNSPDSPLKWKEILSQMYHGLTGKKLTAAILKQGYDGIVPKHPDGSVTEFVNLRGTKSVRVPLPPEASKRKHAALVPFDTGLIDKLRKDFLTLVKNTERVTDYQTAGLLWTAIRTFDANLDEVVFNRLLNSSHGALSTLRFQKLVTESMAEYWDKRLRKSVWTLHIELISFPLSRPDEWHSEGSVFARFQEEKLRWLNRVRVKARPAWQDLNDFITWYTQDYGKTVQLEAPDGDNVEIAGFKVRIEMPPEPSQYLTKSVELLKLALPVYRDRANKVFPWLVEHQVPLVMTADTGLDQAGSYHRDHISLSLWSLSGLDVLGVVRVLAHEMSHAYFKHLGREAETFWNEALRGDSVKLDLKKLLAVWPEGESTVFGAEEKLRETDPYFSLQVGMAFWALNNRHLVTKTEIEQMVAAGDDIWTQKSPITPYASKNSEEAFCETLGHLVAYGPRTVHPLVLQWLKIVEPSIRLASVRNAMPKSMTHEQSVALMKFLSAETQRLGVAKHVYVVGGAVRNFIIGEPIKDIDVVIDTVALKGKNSEWLASEIARNVPTETNIAMNKYGVAILTIKGEWDLDGFPMQGQVIEIANARKETYSPGGYKPERVDPVDIHTDVYRREFTFNTLLWRMLDLAQGPDKAEIIDLTGCGLKDLKDGVMKCPREPDVVFSDDASRMIRAIKFFLKYHFKIPPDVEESIKRNAEKLKNIPASHLSNMLIELFFRTGVGKAAMLEMQKLGLLDVVKEIAKTDKSFREALMNWADSEAEVSFLFELLDMAMPAGKRLNFLSPVQRDRVRQITSEMTKAEATAFLEVLSQPGKVLDTAALITEFKLEGRAIRQLTQTAQITLLEDPSLVGFPEKWADRVRVSMGGTPKVASSTSPCDAVLEFAGRFGHAGSVVDGRTVRSRIDNQSSIAASFTNYKVLSGVREIPMAAFKGSPGAPDARTSRLAEEIKESGEISPLIVVVDAESVKGDGLWVLEGAHRWDALNILKAKAFPAQVVVDLDGCGGGKTASPEKPFGRDIKAMTEEMRALAPGFGYEVVELGSVKDPGVDEEDSIILLRPKDPGDRPQVLVMGGMHGNEPCNVFALHQFFKLNPTVVAPGVAMSILPCVNPIGFRHNYREGLKDKDPNREMMEGEKPSAEGQFLKDHEEVLFDVGRDGVLSLHEDWEDRHFYVFSQASVEDRDTDLVSPQLLAVGAKFFPLHQDGEQAGRGVVKSGIVWHDMNDTSIEEWFSVYGKIPVFTTEIPATYDLTVRIRCSMALAEAFGRVMVGQMKAAAGKPVIRIRMNVWGNWQCFIGTEMVRDYGVEWDAREWLSEQLKTGQYQLSDKSQITMAQVEKHRKESDAGSSKVAARFLGAAQSDYFEQGDEVLFGKWKNKPGIIKEFKEDQHGNPTIVVEPNPKGRKKDKEIGLFKIWHKDPDKREMTADEVQPLEVPEGFRDKVLSTLKGVATHIWHALKEETTSWKSIAHGLRQMWEGEPLPPDERRKFIAGSISQAIGLGFGAVVREFLPYTMSFVTMKLVASVAYRIVDDELQEQEKKRTVKTSAGEPEAWYAQLLEEALIKAVQQVVHETSTGAGPVASRKAFGELDQYVGRMRTARLATKTPGEKEEEEAERLVRPPPKTKPPRTDLRRERVETADPDLKQHDPDLSLNYKKIADRWLVSQRARPPGDVWQGNNGKWHAKSHNKGQDGNYVMRADFVSKEQAKAWADGGGTSPEEQPEPQSGQGEPLDQDETGGLSEEDATDPEAEDVDVDQDGLSEEDATDPEAEDVDVGEGAAAPSADTDIKLEGPKPGKGSIVDPPEEEEIPEPPPPAPEEVPGEDGEVPPKGEEKGPPPKGEKGPPAAEGGVPPAKGEVPPEKAPEDGKPPVEGEKPEDGEKVPPPNERKRKVPPPSEDKDAPLVDGRRTTKMKDNPFPPGSIEKTDIGWMSTDPKGYSYLFNVGKGLDGKPVSEQAAGARAEAFSKGKLNEYDEGVRSGKINPLEWKPPKGSIPPNQKGKGPGRNPLGDPFGGGGPAVAPEAAKLHEMLKVMDKESGSWREGLAERLEAFTPEAQIRAAKAFQSTKASLNGQFKANGLTDEVLDAAKRASRNLNRKGITGEAFGEAAAQAQFARETVANPSMVAGKPLSKDEQDDNALNARAQEAYAQFEGLTPELRDLAFQNATKQLSGMEEGSPEHTELQRIVDGLYMASVAAGDDPSIRGGENALRDEMPSTMVGLVQKWHEDGEDIGDMLKPDFYSPENREKFISHLDSLDDEDLVGTFISRDDPLHGAIMDFLRSSDLEPWQKEYLRKLLGDLVADDFSSIYTMSKSLAAVDGELDQDERNQKTDEEAPADDYGEGGEIPEDAETPEDTENAQKAAERALQAEKAAQIQSEIKAVSSRLLMEAWEALRECMATAGVGKMGADYCEEARNAVRLAPAKAALLVAEQRQNLPVGDPSIRRVQEAVARNDAKELGIEYRGFEAL